LPTPQPNRQQLQLQPSHALSTRPKRHDTLLCAIHFPTGGSASVFLVGSRQRWDALTEECPDCFYRYTARPLLSNVLASLAHYVGAHPAHVVFIENASEGVNTVLRSMRVPPNKKLLFLNTAYGIVKNVMQ
jgi:isopenicillin-N epimerase